MRAPPLSLGLLGLLVGCAEYALDAKSGQEGAELDDSDDYGGGGASEPPPGDTGPDDGLGSEEESDFLALRPAVTRTYVFVVNTDRDTVTRITVETLEVLTAKVGVRPTVALTSADYTRAVTFNEGSDDVSVIDADTLEVDNVEVRPNLNQMKISPDGRWVVVYHDVGAETEDDTDGGGSISYNELSIVDLETRTHHQAVVGAFPHDVQFTADSGEAVVVSDDYLAVISLLPEGPTTERIAISSDLVDPPAAEEVLLDPDGQYAIVRQYGVDELVLVDLVNQTTAPLPVGANPTDMDLSPDGDEAIVISRGANQLWFYSMLDPLGTPGVVDLPAEEILGSLIVSPDDSKALLYSTVSGASRYAVWEREDDSVRVMGLVKPVAGMGVSPSGGTALVFHTEEDGDVSEDSPFYGQNALTMVDLDDYFSNPIQLAAPPTSYANAADGETGFFIMEGEPYLGVLRYGSLLHDMQILPSNPVYLGVLPETNTAYISQEHDLGRISFYDADVDPLESPLQTITGFELNSEIEED